MSDHELEPADTMGQNDTFADAQPMPFETDFTGHIGADGDTDYFTFTADQDGIVTVSIDITASFNAGAIYSSIAAVFTDAWAQSNTGLVFTDPLLSSCDDYQTTKFCPKTGTFQQSVTAAQGTYALRITAMGDTTTIPGFDTQNPYVLRVDFTPGPSLEASQPDVGGAHVGEADTWRTAFPVAFSDGDHGTAQISSHGYYYYDVDWFTFHADANGWVRLVNDIRDAEDGDASVTALTVDMTLYEGGAAGMTDTGISLMVSDSPNCIIDRDEYTEVQGGRDYYIRANSFEWSTTIPYNLTLEYMPGGPEDDQPGVVGAAETAQTAHDLGTVSAGNPLTVQSYLWHYWEYDWFKVRTPSGDGTLEIVVDYTQSYNDLGWYQQFACSTAPDGVKVWSYLYDQAWYASGSNDVSAFLEKATQSDVPTQQISWAATGNSDYYFFVQSRENWDQSNPYTVTVSYTP